jgi:electron transfer flavoprotein alpha subunit
VVVFVERDRDRPREASLGVVAAARQLADSAGATIYALACLTGDDDLDLWASALGAAGADRVAAAMTEEPVGPLIWATCGDIVAEICDRLRPRLVLFAPSSTGRDIAPRLAARLEADFVPDAAIERSPTGDLVLSRLLPGGDNRARHPIAASAETSAVATMSAPPPATKLGDSDIDLVFYEVDRPATMLSPIDQSADPGAAIDTARVVVTAGGGVTAESLALVEALSAALDAELAGTRTACARGLIPEDRMVGIGGRRIAPELYVAVGASGSESHLGAIAADAEIIAINADANAPIVEVASYALVGDLDEILPALVAELGG